MAKMRSILMVGLLALFLTLLVAASGASAQPGPTVEVTMQNLAYQPDMIAVPAGTTVVWTNLDAAEHTVTADDYSFGSDFLYQGQTFSLTFDTPGTYPYYCVPHGYRGGLGMAGVVIVE